MGKKNGDQKKNKIGDQKRIVVLIFFVDVLPAAKADQPDWYRI